MKDLGNSRVLKQLYHRRKVGDGKRINGGDIVRRRSKLN